MDMYVEAVEVRTCVGASRPATVAAMRAGVSGWREHPYMLDNQGEPIIMARDSLLGGEHGSQRIVAMLASALLELSRAVRRIHRVALVLAVPEQRAGLPADLPRIVEAECVSKLGPFVSIEHVPAAQATAVIVAVELARARLLTGLADAALIVAADSLVDAEQVESWLREGSLWRRGHSSGRVPGEAAFACLVSNVRNDSLGTIRGIHVSPPSPDADQTVSGTVLARAIVEAIGESDFRVPQIVYCEAASTRAVADEYGFALMHVLRRYPSYPHDFHTGTPTWGDVGVVAAGLLIGAALTPTPRVPIRHALVWALASDQDRSAILVECTPR